MNENLYRKSCSRPFRWPWFFRRHLKATKSFSLGHSPYSPSLKLWVTYWSSTFQKPLFPSKNHVSWFGRLGSDVASTSQGNFQNSIFQNLHCSQSFHFIALLILLSLHLSFSLTKSLNFFNSGSWSLPCLVGKNPTYHDTCYAGRRCSWICK